MHSEAIAICGWTGLQLDCCKIIGFFDKGFVGPGETSSTSWILEHKFEYFQHFFESLNRLNCWKILVLRPCLCGCDGLGQLRCSGSPLCYWYLRLRSREVGGKSLENSSIEPWTQTHSYVMFGKYLKTKDVLANHFKEMLCYVICSPVGRSPSYKISRLDSLVI